MVVYVPWMISVQLERKDLQFSCSTPSKSRNLFFIPSLNKIESFVLKVKIMFHIRNMGWDGVECGVHLFHSGPNCSVSMVWRFVLNLDNKKECEYLQNIQDVNIYLFMFCFFFFFMIISVPWLSFFGQLFHDYLKVGVYLLPEAEFPTGGLYFKNKTWAKK